jgi:phosphate transport system protein
MSRHISEQYDNELESARNLLLELGGLVEHQVQQACLALYSHDAKLAEEVRAGDRQINLMEVEIDELCVQIIARRQPAATDLRTLISILKAGTDLERVGDEAKRIAKMVIQVANLEVPGDQYGAIRNMADKVVLMLGNALDAFTRSSAESAVAVIEMDETVDEAYDEIVRHLGAEMKAHPENIEQLLTVLWIARALERCGDHAKNLSEYIIYLVKGQDVRHGDPAAVVSES